MAEGLVKFRERYRTLMWLEVFLLNAVTSMESEVRKIAQWVRRIAPDSVQLNTVTRPPAEDYAFPVPKDVLNRLAVLFEPPAEVIAEFKTSSPSFNRAATQEDILALLVRRPCTLKDVAEGLGVHVAEAAKHLEALAAAGRATAILRDGQCFYAVKLHEGIC
jgi:wyosine [tRNA(Phe)-imidazoG37] synthetase (radical SAM superfamily)